MAETDKVPNWSKQSVGYQCFVDSFARQEINQAIANKEVYHQKAYNLEWHEHDKDYHYGRGFYGGNLKGINQAAQTYLNDLGINLLYLTPIFEAESNHKYDTLNYEKIDAQFGTLDDFKQLIATCEKQGMNVILDGVFNHISSNHPWHQAAIKGDEKFLNRFKRNEQGFIKHWEGVQTMPLLNHQHPDVKRYFYQGPNNIINKWIELGASGWRLDVAERLGKRAIKDIRTSLKQNHREALLIGEVVESFGEPWLADGLLDGVMNYVFRGVTVNFLKNKIDAMHYLSELTNMVNHYPFEKLCASWNIISTHDTNRMLFDVNGDEGFFKLAVVAQFTFPGVPMIYYGDELGMLSGQKGISNRMGMDWDSVKLGKRYLDGFGDPMDWEITKRYNSFHEFYKHMIWMRQNHRSLIEGSYHPVEINESCLAYFRALKNEATLIVINRDSDQEITIEIPEAINLSSESMSCIYGQDHAAQINNRQIKFKSHGRNAYVFVC